MKFLMKLKALLKNRNINNAAWLIGGKIFQSILGLVVSIFTARYLGPSNYGLISYAASIVAFLVPIMQLGFNNILVQELTNYPDEEGKVMGTSILLSFFSGIACILGIFCFTLVANPGERVTTVVCVLYGIMLMPEAIEMIRYWYQYKLLSKYTSIISFIAYIIVSAYKIFLLATHQKVYWFAISYSIDYFIIAVALLIIYKKLGRQAFSFSKSIAKRMFSKSKYYIISNLMVVVFAQTDKVMIKLMINDSATGYYTAAVTTAGMTSFIYAAIIDSLRPTIFEHKKNDDKKGYEKNITVLYSIIIYLSFFQSIIMTLLAPWIIKLMYGPDYTAAVSALQIIVWYTTFSYYGGAKDVWVLAEGKQKYLIWLNMSGALANVGLNLIFIPLVGINGAAFASLITQIFTNIIMIIIIKPLRNNQKLLFRALNPKILINIFRS